jgi:hypothetical protein
MLIVFFQRPSSDRPPVFFFRFVATVDPSFIDWLREFRSKVHPECDTSRSPGTGPFAPFGGSDPLLSSYLGRGIPAHLYPSPGTGGARVSTVPVRNSPLSHGFSRGASALPFHRDAALTWFLLSEADDMVVSGTGSSYGETAAAYGGLVPVVCNSMQVCVRKLMPEPADHAKPSFGRDSCAKHLVEKDPLHHPHMYTQVDNFPLASKMVWNAYSVVKGDNSTVSLAVLDMWRIEEPPLAKGHIDPNTHMVR